MKKLGLILLAMLTVFSFAACSNGRFMNADEIKDIVNPKGQIVISYTDSNDRELWQETLEFELYYKQAPITVTNFVHLVNDGHFNGVVFHKIEISSSTDTPKAYIAGQYTDYAEDKDNNYKRIGFAGEKAIDYKIMGEFSKNSWEPKETQVKHDLGVMGMFREESDYNSAKSNFYISSGKMPERDGYYATFGKITGNGQVVSDKMSTIETEELTDNTDTDNVKKWYNAPVGTLKIVSVTVNIKSSEIGSLLKI